MDRVNPRLVRRIVDLMLVVLVGTVGVVALIGILAPRVGYLPLVISGASMEPAIARGSLVLDADVGGPAVRAGDVVSFREANGTIITHRVEAITGSGDAGLLTTKGDANPAGDPAAVPVARVIGRVALALPALGFVSAMLGMPSGILAIALLALALMVVSFLLAELSDTACAGCAAGGAASAAGDAVCAAAATGPDPVEKPA